MSEPATSPAPAKTGRAMRLALAISVAVNLAVAGLAVGILLHGRSHHHDGMVRSVGFGPFTDALRPADRSALHEAFLKTHPDFQAERAQMKADSDAVLSALRAKPYDPVAMEAAMAQMQAHVMQRFVIGRNLMESFINAMTTGDRLAFANRLEATLRHRAQREGSGKSAAPADATTPAPGAAAPSSSGN